MALYITGSLAYDRIMTFPGKIKDSILMDHLHILNVSFFIDQLDEMLGGNAGNIAYSLALLEEKPIIVSTAGKDFTKYKKVLEHMDLSLEGITILKEELTAGAYIITDQDNNQITAFHAAALLSPSKYKFPNLDPKNDFALIGPSNPQDMIGHAKLFKEKGVRYIFDPAQQLPVLDPKDIKEYVKGAYLLMGNDYEITLISETTGLSLKELVENTQRGVIVTYGAKGSKIFEKGKGDIQIPAVAVSDVKDPTGAGDAYRAGVLKGLKANKSLEICGKLGATASAYCLESLGTQGHRFNLERFSGRYVGFFEEDFPL